MAFIARFEQRPLTPRAVHKDVLCGYNAIDVKGQQILQLETYGTDDREMPGKISQSLQLDRDGAAQLKQILERAFPGI
ncbi:MAG: hypothetical protein AB7W59_21605 [Acidimicrobiia bacterium]